MLQIMSGKCVELGKCGKRVERGKRVELVERDKHVEPGKRGDPGHEEEYFPRILLNLRYRRIYLLCV